MILLRTLVLVLLVSPLAGAEVTLRSLIGEIADLERLTRFPSPSYVTRQSSSYDRASKSPADPEGWFANGDRGQYLRIDERRGRKERVLLDAAGPGAVVRIWSANPEGTLRLYVDGEEEPALEAPMEDLLRGKVAPFLAPLAHEASRGFNLYFPFPYAKRVLITTDHGDIYYHVNYRTYAEGTRIQSTSKESLADAGGDAAKACAALLDPGSTEASRGGGRRSEARLSTAGRKLTLQASPGGEVIRELVLKPSSTSPEALRRTLLTASFDGKETVTAPLGDFFGTGPGLNAYDSLPFSVAKDGTLTCRWPMPFRETAVFELRSSPSSPSSPPGSPPEGARLEVEAAGHVTHSPRAWDESSLLFHAKWRAEVDMKTDPPRDWRFVSIEGQGIYVGNVLDVANPVRAWWGEGDEKIYVDGEDFPSHFGTGTEDYYGYAWCSPAPFSNPFHAQTRCDGPGNSGHTSVNRWHVLDDIPFSRSFRFDMEVWHWNRKVRVSYGSASFWYARPDARDDIPAPGEAALRIPVLPERKVLAVKDAIEGEGLRVVEKKGSAEPQDMASFEDGAWSRDSQLWWRGAKPGDRLVLELPPVQPGRYRVILRLTKAIDYGIHQLFVNGTKAGTPIDLFADRVLLAEPLDLGAHDLEAEGNRLAIEVIGTNPRANPKNHMFGLDYVLLQGE